MIRLLLATFISIALWTSFAILNKGRKYQEIRDVLHDINLNLTSIISNVFRLTLLLIKDAIDPNSLDISTLLTNKTFKRNDSFSRTQNIQNESYELREVVISDIQPSLNHDIFDDMNEDSSITGLSSEFIEILEEEERVA